MFYGILIKMFYEEHNPPHFHAYYNEYQALIGIHDFRILQGSLPPKALALVMEWAMLHKKELLEEWERIEKKLEIFKIEPLK
ncbi:DUF4160 domain-containing protein [Marispirochaeta sp.]|uniref:DUF4160 domain-containing protein n=1 Tax=Marispirochaeta sp. TaxID=2038653 RepID=UPI0029C942DE|nr:DUF4160 domain-containing protein [Marispirochaeta sp.]